MRALVYAHANQLGIERFQIGQHQQLMNCRVFAPIAGEFGIGAFPLFGGLPKQRDVRNVGLVGIGFIGLGVGDCRWSDVE